jgi:hypothetical protein
MASRHPLQYLIRPETMKAHRAAWHVYSGPCGELERVQSGRTYTGMGYDVMCSCGAWESRTGGALRHSVEDALWEHRSAEQAAADEGLPNSDPATWAPEVLAEYLARDAEAAR